MNTFILRTAPNGVDLDAVCSGCEAVLVRNLPNARAAYCRVGEMTPHVCTAEKPEAPKSMAAAAGR